jgi:hypothetical protein
MRSPAEDRAFVQLAPFAEEGGKLIQTDPHRVGILPTVSVVASSQPESPAQLVVGTGGDILEPDTKYYPSGDEATLYKVNGHLWTRKTFGFVVLTRADPDPDWVGTFYHMYGVPIIKCSFETRLCA